MKANNGVQNTSQRRRPKRGKLKGFWTVAVALAGIAVGVPSAIVGVPKAIETFNPPGVVVEFGLPLSFTSSLRFNGIEVTPPDRSEAFAGVFSLTNRSDHPVTVLDVALKPGAPSAWNRTHFLSADSSQGKVATETFGESIDQQFVISAHSSVWLVVAVQAAPGTCGQFREKCAEFELRINDGRTMAFGGYESLDSCQKKPESPCGRSLGPLESAMSARTLGHAMCTDLKNWTGSGADPARECFPI